MKFSSFVFTAGFEKMYFNTDDKDKKSASQNRLLNIIPLRIIGIFYEFWSLRFVLVRILLAINFYVGSTAVCHC